MQEEEPQKQYREEILSIFDQVRPVDSHIEVCLPSKPTTPNNIGEGLSVPQMQLWKDPFLFNTKREKMLAFFQISSQSNTSLKEQK